MAIIECRHVEHVAVLTLNDGENRLNPPFISSFLEVLDKVEKETDALSLVVTSAHEKIFCNGLDLKWLLPHFQRQDAAGVRDFFGMLNRLFKRILLYPMITVAAISGHAFAGGAILACAFDFRFMRTDRGFFCLPEIDLGIPFLPGMHALLRKAIPAYKLEEMQYAGTRLTAEDCKKHHIVTEAFHQRDLMPGTLEFAKGFRKQRAVIREMKARIHKDIIHSLDHEDRACVESEGFSSPWMSAVGKEQ